MQSSDQSANHPPPSPVLVRFMLTTLLILATLFAVLWLASALLRPTPVGPAQAPLPGDHPEALVRIYGADVWGVRGRFAVHTWISTKAAGGDDYRNYQVIGWHLRRRGTVLSVTEGAPDRPWFGSPPILLYELTGATAEDLIEPIDRAAKAYPYAGEYSMWPGPNSNSFTQWVITQVPELTAALPQKAIGKNWMLNNIDEARALVGRKTPEID